jgi:hypothetical protein
MNEFEATAVMIGLFALRCVVPLLITIGLGRLMNRLIDHWAAEDEEARRRRTRAPLPAPVPAQASATGDQSIPLPCWILRNCDEKKRAQCAAYRRQGIPCWQARLIEEGRLPEPCPTCPQYLGPQLA